MAAPGVHRIKLAASPAVVQPGRPQWSWGSRRSAIRSERRGASTLAALEQDADLRGDLQRWRALVRSLAQHRDALAGGLRGLPFRCEFTAQPATEA